MERSPRAIKRQSLSTSLNAFALGMRRSSERDEEGAKGRVEEGTGGGERGEDMIDFMLESNEKMKMFPSSKSYREYPRKAKTRRNWNKAK